MTIEELSKYHDIKVECDDLTARIKELEMTILKSSKFSDSKVSSNGNSNPTEQLVIKLTKLKEKYNIKQYCLIEEMEKIEDYLNTIKDSEIRTIMRKRFFDLLTWEQVAAQLNYSNPVPYYKVRKYLNGK